MVQDIFPHHFENTFMHRPPQPEDFVLAYDGDRLLMAHDGDITLPTVAQISGPLQYLFTLDDRGYYLLEAPAPAAPAGFAYEGSREYRSWEPAETRYACAVAESLHRWYRGNRFCGCCGTPVEKSKTERAMVCPACGNTVYPKICLAVIVGVCDGDRLLLTKYNGRVTKQYALVAGFAEIGETIEETVRREVFEEVGLKLGQLRFYKSQPWVFTDTLLMGFYAQLHGDDAIRLQEEELSLGQWFHRSELPDDHSGISLTGEMIETFRRGQDPFSLARHSQKHPLEV